MIFYDLHMLTAVVRRHRDPGDRKWTRSTNFRRNGIGWKKIDGRSATLLISSLTSRFVAALSASMIAQVRDQRLGIARCDSIVYPRENGEQLADQQRDTVLRARTSARTRISSRRILGSDTCMKRDMICAWKRLEETEDTARRNREFRTEGAIR